MIRRGFHGIVLTGFAVWGLAPAPVSSQGPGDWQVPAGFVPAPQASQPPQRTAGGPITFGEAEFPLGSPVDGLVVSSIGGAPLAAPVTFSFTPPDARVSGGPGTTAWIDDPSIEGDATGTLTIDFGIDVTRVVFGFAQNCAAGNSASSTVTAINAAANIVGSTTVPGQDLGFFFLENQVDFAPGRPFRSVDVSFDNSGGMCFRFVLDNLAYDVAAVPTMSAPARTVFTLVLLAVGTWILKRRVCAN